MLEVDSRNLFQKDDEVGTVFNQLKQLINTINDKYVEDDDVE